MPYQDVQSPPIEALDLELLFPIIVQFTDSGLLSIIYPAALFGYKIYCSLSPSYLRFLILPASEPDPTKVSGYGDFSPGFETWSLSRFVGFVIHYLLLCLESWP